jgi:hypothetical protein
MSMKQLNECPRCGIEASLKVREFSAQAIVSLIDLGDLEEDLVGMPICGECYTELRDVLVENHNPVVDKKVAV